MRKARFGQGSFASQSPSPSVSWKVFEATQGYGAAIRNELGHLPALVDVSRTPGRIHVTVQVPDSQRAAMKLSAVADRARHAVRTHDPYVNAIDVSVVCYPDPS